MNRPKARKPRGFTLIELLVVIAIIGILGTITTAVTVAIRSRARNSVIYFQLVEAKRGMQLLTFDTGAGPAGCASIGTLDTEIVLNDIQSGLVYPPTVGSTGTDCAWSSNEVANWKGPYVTRSIDPWGNPYWFDPDYYPRQDCPTNNANPGAKVVRAIFSLGQNGVGGAPPWYSYDCDDVYFILDPVEFSNL